LVGVLGAEVLGGVDHVGQRSLGLGPLAGLQTAVGVDPELLRAETVVKHLLDAGLDLLLGGNTRRVDVVDTRADVAGVGLLLEDTEELGVRLAVLDGQDIGIEGSDGVEEVLELGVAKVRVDLSGVLDTGGGQLEGVNSPGEVSLTLLAGAERETLTESRLVDLDDVDAGGLEVDDLVAESQSKLLGLDGLVNVVTGERPAQAGDGTSKHALHDALGVSSSVLGLLDGHGLVVAARDVTDNDGGTDAAGSVGLDPGVGGEDVTVHALTEVLNHVVTLGLTVDEDVQVKLVLDGDDIVHLLLDELLVLLSGNLTLGELVALDTDLLGLGEGADGGGREERKVQVLLLGSNTSGELRLAVVHLRGDLRLALLDVRVVGAGRRSAGLDVLGVGIKLGLDGGSVGDGLGNGGNLNGLLGGEGEPGVDLLRELLLGGKSVGGVEEGRRGGDDDTVLAELGNSLLDGVNGAREVGLPDVTAVDDTGGQDLLGAELLNDGAELLGVADKVDVEAVDVADGGEDVKVVDDVTEVGGQNQLGEAGGGESLVGGLEGSLGLLGEVEDEDGLVNLDSLGTSGLELLQELNVDGDELVEQRDGVNGLATVGLSQVEERDGADKDGAGDDAGLLGLVELNNGLGVGSELEGLAILEGRLDIVYLFYVMRFFHRPCMSGGGGGAYQRGDVDAVLLVAAAHGEVLVNGLKLGLGVTGRNGLRQVVSLMMGLVRFRELDVVKDLVVEGKVVGGDDVDTGILLDLPVGETQSLTLSEELIARELAGPVSLVGLLEVTVHTHAGETKNRGLNHLECCC
ncbi:putative 5-methyltetrahydropteroyltriglutamate--homocysteine methyltransferase, partial [Colletotrichum gloeosporioides]